MKIWDSDPFSEEDAHPAWIYTLLVILLATHPRAYSVWRRLAVVGVCLACVCLLIFLQYPQNAQNGTCKALRRLGG